jgi:hypothetical protein
MKMLVLRGKVESFWFLSYNTHRGKRYVKSTSGKRSATPATSCITEQNQAWNMEMTSWSLECSIKRRTDHHAFYKLYINKSNFSLAMVSGLWQWIAILMAQTTFIITTEEKRLKVQSYYTAQVPWKMVAKTHRWERKTEPDLYWQKGRKETVKSGTFSGPL